MSDTTGIKNPTDNPTYLHNVPSLSGFTCPFFMNIFSGAKSSMKNKRKMAHLLQSF
jgi:glycerol kinase